VSVTPRRGARPLVVALLATSLLGSAFVPAVVLAQPADTAATISSKPLFTKRDAWMAVGFLALTAAMTPLDERIAQQLQDPGTQANELFEKGSVLVEYIAAPGAFIIGGGLYAAGRLGGNERMADLGWHGTEAVLLGTGAYVLGKGLFGRARPETVDAKDPRSYKFGRGFKGGPYASFPSGHTTTAFAAAAAVTAETSMWWPRSKWIIGPLMYGGATAVGLSRMYNNKHWASDVAMGALLGTFSGIKVVRYHHSHPDNRLDRIMLGMQVMPLPDGAVLAVRLTPRLVEFPARPR
jgi:membrane-associated phospholipid phosphatase